MLGAYLTGLVLGLILAVMTSPAFFALINITSTRGYEAGAMFVAGTFTSHLIFFILSLIFYDLIIYEYQLQRFIFPFIYILIVICCLLIIFNFERKIISKAIIYMKATKPLTIYLKGILLNLFNLVIIISWMGVFLFYFMKIDLEKNDFVFYFTGIITTVLIFDILKLFSSGIFTHKINPLYLIFLNKIIAIGAIVFFTVNLF